MTECDRAVILAAGLGTRMRKAAESEAGLTAEQAAAAATGVKAMIPIDRPFLDYVLTALRDAGYRRVCLVIGPTHDAVRRYYEESAPAKHLELAFAVQPEPRGTADALRAAESFAAGRPVVMLNSDNHYPLEALRGLREAGDGQPHAVALFTRAAMLAGSNIDADRVGKFAAVETADGAMLRIHEKPSPETLATLGEPVLLSMNCWRFGPSVFEACAKLRPSARGEYEITDAAQMLIDEFGEPVGAQVYDLPVLDLSSRGDIEPVARRLRGGRVEY